MLVSLALGDANLFAFYPTRNLNIAFYPTPTPDASRWNIGGVGPSIVGAGVGHVLFMLFMSISFAMGTQRKLVFQWNMGLRVRCLFDMPRDSEYMHYSVNK